MVHCGQWREARDTQAESRWKLTSLTYLYPLSCNDSCSNCCWCLWTLYIPIPDCTGVRPELNYQSHSKDNFMRAARANCRSRPNLREASTNQKAGSLSQIRVQRMLITMDFLANTGHGNFFHPFLGSNLLTNIIMHHDVTQFLRFAGGQRGALTLAFWLRQECIKRGSWAFSEEAESWPEQLHFHKNLMRCGTLKKLLGKKWKCINTHNWALLKINSPHE